MTTTLTSTTVSTAPRDDSRRRADRTRSLVRIAAGAAGGFAVLTVVAGLLDPGYDLRSEAISALGSTESASAPAMIAGFALLGLSTLLSGVSVLRLLRGKAAVVSSVLLLLAGGLTVAEGPLRQSCSSLQEACLARESAGDVSASHVLHNLLALPLLTFLVVAGFVLVVALRRNAASRSMRRWVLLGALASTVFFVWFGSSAYGTSGGLVQRGLVVLAYGLPLATLVVLLRTPRRRHGDAEQLAPVATPPVDHG